MHIYASGLFLQNLQKHIVFCRLVIYNDGNRVGFSSLSAAKMGSCLVDEGVSRA